MVLEGEPMNAEQLIAESERLNNEQLNFWHEKLESESDPKYKEKYREICDTLLEAKNRAPTDDNQPVTEKSLTAIKKQIEETSNSRDASLAEVNRILEVQEKKLAYLKSKKFKFLLYGSLASIYLIIEFLILR